MKKPTKEAGSLMREPSKAYLEATKLNENIYKGVFYIHSEFTKMLREVVHTSGLPLWESPRKGEEKKTSHQFKRVEEQIIRRYGMTKVEATCGPIYLQDEVRKDASTSNLISIGPDKATLEFIETLNEKGHQDKSAREAFIKRREAEYERVFAAHNEEGGGKGNCGTYNGGAGSNPKETEGDGRGPKGKKNKKPGEEAKKRKAKA